ncbi:PAS domain S-box protein [Hymenobacter sp. UV11]|uniref:PAS domain-containing sensor histidine kinase n=1 Tax=Hymenobacter sp. UV11 TaxID=1849735 RepID=UPI00105C8C22|nr:PAS domain-containing protein [Hymenobacter sp. UV11]TDN36201.1 hypothetical protein A8B98_09745 [Hymenobacter sp. UV11]TFZ66903.1 PAS domain S-box protein [Hymenobacter sp. UV11]
MPAASSTDLSALLPIFDALPAPYLLLTPSLVIEAVSDAFLAATLTERANLLGSYLFDAFPDNPDTPEANGVSNLRASLDQVLATGLPHEMARQRYDAPDPDRPGHFVERHWLPRNTPVLDAQGRVSHIIHAVLNVTDHVQAEARLRESQAREQAAAAAVEAQRQQLYQTFQEAPAMICVFDGPQHVFQFVNPPYQALVGDRPLVGKPIAEAMPELVGQPIFELLDGVYRTGETYRANEMPVQLDHDNLGSQTLEKRYYNFIYQARHGLGGEITGIFVFAYDVTTQVLARRQVQELNEELATINEELYASNEEFLQANSELTHTQLQLQQLNQELEARVAARTQDARAARAETERQRRQLEDLFMRAPAAISIFGGPNWVYELVNPGYQQLFPGRRLLGLPLLQALPEVAGQPLLDILNRVYTTGIPFEGKEVLVSLARHEGGPLEEVYFDLTYQARFDETGQIDGFVTYANDVTAQVLARRERVMQEQRLRELFEQAPMAIAVFRGVNYILDVVNPSMGAMWGYPPAQLVGQPFFTALSELQGQGLRELLDRVRLSGQPYVAQEWPVQLARHQPGTTGYFNFVYQPLWGADGQQTGIVCVATDMTTQVLARQQVQNLNEELAAINEEMQATNEELGDTNRQLTRTNVDLDNFIYTASHDLKQPIANIEGLLQALTHELPAEARQAALVQPILERMHAAVERFQKTIGDLTEVSKLQQAHDQPAQEVRLRQVIEEVALDLDPVLAALGWLEVAVPLGQVVTFSEKNLRSVVYNLLSNALKYCAPGRPLRVQVSSQLRGNSVELRVQDNGLGLDAAQQARLFGLFQRLHTHVEGTGIGLYMVKKIVENAGGTIAVQSELGVGSSFIVLLPN